MNAKKHPADLSYFRLLLTAFLRESHPQLLNNEKFITTRNDTALDAYEQSVRDGGNPRTSTSLSEHSGGQRCTYLV